MQVTATLNREGAVESLEIKGTMYLTAHSEDVCKCRVIMAPTKSPLFSYQTNPKVDKKGFETEGVLALKDATKGFPKSKAVGVLRWSVATTDDEQVGAGRRYLTYTCACVREFFQNTKKSFLSLLSHY